MQKNATAKGAWHPTDIVVFRPKSQEEDILKVLAGATGIAGFRSEQRPGVTILTPTTGGDPVIKLYKELGLAALDLTDDWRRDLAAQDAVVGIFPNRERRVPERRPPRTAVPQDTEQLSPSLVRMGITDATIRTGVGVKVAVLDTGIDLQHPDFENRIEPGNAVSFVEGETVQDGWGHGTHCAGLVAGPMQPSTGPRYAVAPGAELLVGKIIDKTGGGWDDHIFAALAWATIKGAKIVSMSFGSYREQHQENDQVYEFVANLLQNHFNVLLVAAAGNYSHRPDSTAPVIDPAAADAIVAVAAVDGDDQISFDSCKKMDEYGDVTISAPGVDIHSAWTEKTYWSDSGTSYATAHVAGIAALHLEQASLNATGLRQALIDNKEALGDPADYGAGLAKAPA